MNNIEILLSGEHEIKCLIIKENNCTVYYNNFDSLLKFMEFSTSINEELSCPFTYEMEHLSESSAKNLYHNDIDPSYTDEGHYHFQRKDNQLFTSKDIEDLFSLFEEHGLMTLTEAELATAAYKRQVSLEASIDLSDAKIDKGNCSSPLKKR
jgi:hypothetical protein